MVGEVAQSSGLKSAEVQIKKNGSHRERNVMSYLLLLST